jgi:hypothetical protein
MAVLTTDQKRRAWKTFIQEAWGNGAVTLTKLQLEAAADAANNWADAAQSSYNTALTNNAAAFAGVANAQQKALLLVYVLAAKYDLFKFLAD